MEVKGKLEVESLNNLQKQKSVIILEHAESKQNSFKRLAQGCRTLKVNKRI